MLRITKIVVLLAGLISFHGGVQAHSKVTITEPENKAVLQETPTAIKLNFANKIRLTKVTLQRAEQEVIDLDLSNDKGFKNKFSLLNTSKGNGLYKINWRGLSIDGHVMQGKFSFTVE